MVFVWDGAEDRTDCAGARGAGAFGHHIGQRPGSVMGRVRLLHLFDSRRANEAELPSGA
ncbi:hypothetical protein D9M68_953470 [compost metagenome]